MGLENGNKKLTYLNISNGKLVYKESGSEEKKSADSVSGVVKKVEFCDDEYQGQSFNKVKTSNKEHICSDACKESCQMKANKTACKENCKMACCTDNKS